MAVLHMTLVESWHHVKLDGSTYRVFGSPAWALILVEKHKAKEKKIQTLICVGYCEDMKAYRLFNPISKELFFQRVFFFDECFNPTSSPSPPSNYHIDNGVDHVDSFSFVEEEEDDHFEDEHHPTENFLPAPTEHE